MKIKYLFTSTIIALTTLVAYAQEGLLKTVLENNKELIAAREAVQVALLAAGTGNTPPDPELEFGYLFDRPEVTGNRVDFRVSQELDFPSAYFHRSRMRKIRNRQAELEYIRIRQAVLLRARQLWIERIYLVQAEALVSERLRQAEEINKHFRLKVAEGEAGKLAFSHSNLQTVVMNGTLDKVRSEIRTNQIAMEEISGGSRVTVTELRFPVHVPIDADTLIRVYGESPDLLYHDQILLMRNEQMDLAFSQHLPRFSAGYYSETVIDQNFRGFEVGVSVPLWENQNRLKQAKSELLYAEADLQRYELHQRTEVMRNLDLLESLNGRILLLEEALTDDSGLDALALALENGEISLTEYFYASGLYFENQQLLLEYKRDRLMTEAVLLKVYL